MLSCVPMLVSSDGSWSWDRETKVKAQGLKAALTSFQTLAVFLITKNILDEVKTLASNLQKRDQDIYEACKTVHVTIESLKTLRVKIDTIFTSWYDEILKPC